MNRRVFKSWMGGAAPRLALVLTAALAAASTAMAQNARAPIRDPQRVFRSYVCTYKEIKEYQVVMQKYDYSCGAAALATIVRYYWGDPVDEARFLDLLPKLRLSEAELKDRIENGLTLTDLRNIAQSAGYDAVMGKVPFSELAQGKVPVVVGITVDKHDHFAVFRGTDGRYAYLADPIRGNIRTPVPDFTKQWQKNAILVVAKRGSGAKDVNPMGLRIEEVERGVLNEQWVHRNGLMPTVPRTYMGP